MFESIPSRFMILIVVFAATLAARSQEFDPHVISDIDLQNAIATQRYTPPTKQTTIRDFVGETIGPYPLTMAAFTAAFHHGTDNPPEWRQGAAALSKRFGSSMGVTAVGNATRYSLAALLHEDTSYYRCRCTGVPHRMGHAAFSALIARRLFDGSSVFSVPGLAAPYAATMTATYAWYPARYGAKDAFRMGNYNLLGTVGSNIAFEFIPRKVWKKMEQVHLASRRVAEQD